MTEEQVFLAALELHNPAERAAYLDKVCGGDAGFRRQVEDLLAAHFRSGEFLDEPVGKQMGADQATPSNDNTMTFRDNLGGDAVADKKGPGEEPNDFYFLQKSTRPDSLGRIGHYEILQVLGKGGFGIVFRAFDEVLQRVVALKVLAPAIAATSPARKRFIREARSSAKVRHENVVQVYAVEEQPLPYLVMEFIPGETLQQLLNRTGPLDVSDILQIGRQIAEGLAEAHATNLIHRDIKPGNVLLEGGQQRVKITDFGLARAADDASLTQSGVLAGTPMYMAPEQARGETLDHRADLFSLGSVMYVMATGRPPFRAATTYAVLKRVVEEDPRPIRDVIPEVPQWLCKIIARLQAKKPEDRFATAREVADLLARCQAEMQRSGNESNLVDMPVPSPSPLSPNGRGEGEGATAKVQPSREISATAPANRGARSRTGRWAGGAVLLILLGGLVITEATGVTDFRGTIFRQFTPEVTPVVNQKAPPDGEVAKAGGNGSNPKAAPGEKKVSTPDTKQTVEVIPPAPSIHDVWFKALGILPLENQGAAVATKMKEQLPGFEEAFLKAIPAMSADRQAIMVDVWLKERKPAFAGFEDAWLKVMPAMSADVQALLAEAWLKERNPAFAGYEDTWFKAIPAMPADTQVILLAAWLKERNPTFDGSLKHKAEGSVVTSLEVPAPIVQDLTPLRALTGLKTLICRSTIGYDNKAEHDAVVLRSLKALETINGKPVAAFWKEVVAKQAEFKEWLQLVPSLTAEQQAIAVAVKLKERNPGSDVNVTHQIEDGMVTEMLVSGGNVTDLSPVRVLAGLKSLECDQIGGGRVLSDLSPLKDMKLTSLSLQYIPVTDLSPLKDLKLTSLKLIHTRVTDLSLLKDMPLMTLHLNGSPVSDLSPLKDNRTLMTLNLGMTGVTDLSPLKDTNLTELGIGRTSVKDLSLLKDLKLTSLRFNETAVNDLSPLKDLKLTSLIFYNTPVSDLSPLKGMPLAELNCKGSKVTDLSPLKELPLTKIECNFQPERDAKILSAIQTLKTINGKPAKEVLK